MSHVTEAKAGLHDVNEKTLYEALCVLAKHLPGGEVVRDTFPTDWQNRTQNSQWWKRKAPCKYLLRWDGFKHGIGYDVIDKDIAATVDWWRHEKDVKATMEQVKKLYVLQAGVKKLARMGYSARVRKVGNEFTVKGVRV